MLILGRAARREPEWSSLSDPGVGPGGEDGHNAKGHSNHYQHSTLRVARRRPVNVTCTPASRLSVVTVRTGRACGAAASMSGWHAGNLAGNTKANNAVRSSRQHTASNAPRRSHIA